MALDTLDGQLHIDGAAPSDLDHVAEDFRAGRLADDAVVDDLALRFQGLHDHLGAMGRDTFFIASDQEGERTPHIAR